MRTTDAIERLHREFKRRARVRCALPDAGMAAVLFWALMAHRADHHGPRRWLENAGPAPVKQPIDLAASLSNHRDWELRRIPISTDYRSRPSEPPECSRPLRKSSIESGPSGLV